MIRKIVRNIYAFGKDMSRHNSAAYASSIAFFFFLSLIPSLMFIFSLFRYLPLDEADIINLLRQFVPAALMPTARELVDGIYSSSASFLPITAIATLWTANMGMFGLIRGLNGVLELTDNRNYIVLRLISTVYTLLMLSGLIISLIIMGFGKTLLGLILKFIPRLDMSILNLIGFRYLIIFVILTVMFTLAYTFLPAKNQKFLLSVPGAAIAALGWILVTWIFSIYIEYFHGFSIYGSLTLIMALLFWLYACFSMLIIGAFLNKYYKTAFEHRLVRFRVKRETKRGEKQSSKRMRKDKNE